MSGHTHMVERRSEGGGASRFVVRPAQAGDFGAIHSIYADSVTSSAASFEIEPPATDEMLRRWRSVAVARCPYLVAERGDEVVGFAYARPFHERAAFAWTVENSVYVAAHYARQGVGRLLLAALIEAATDAGFRQMVALISSDAAPASVPLHEAAGFRVAGRLAAVGYKHGRWHDIVHMQLPLGQGSATRPTIPVP